MGMFSVVIYYKLLQDNKDATKKVQRSATKMVHGLHHLSYEQRLRHLELTTLKERRIRGDLTEKENVDRSQFFQLSTCEYQLTGHAVLCVFLFEQIDEDDDDDAIKLSKQRTSLDVRKFSFSQCVVQEWNKLFQDVLDATSLNQFKNRLDKFWQRYGH